MDELMREKNGNQAVRGRVNLERIAQCAPEA